MFVGRRIVDVGFCELLTLLMAPEPGVLLGALESVQGDLGCDLLVSSKAVGELGEARSGSDVPASGLVAMDHAAGGHLLQGLLGGRAREAPLTGGLGGGGGVAGAFHGLVGHGRRGPERAEDGPDGVDLPGAIRSAPRLSGGAARAAP